ncbi:phosphate signaling complex protein PhoU [Mariniblastus fucicola]|uniref:Phosphate-specific transport system accessory protein PhoU n=1 Tax=Mariniblastus fucicola TaxID=980251 RepID=A0A5B9PD58_9BACT|nr:phosphate signaling complex protein PhoU [Mariniblastus fucicola]QEG23020.1 hypothetical protein MFFC18_29120 [Mariniblastus fucicola]
MTRLEKILANILDELLLQSEQVEEMVELGLRSIEDRCDDAVAQVQTLERTINDREVKIEEACLATIALHHPAASDLRLAATILKVNGDLERIGDLALNLTERAEALREYEQLAIPTELAEMVRYSLSMVRDAHRALQEKDVALAQRVCHRDDQLDAMNRELIVSITDQMKQASDLLSGQLHIFSASRIIERIGDHATNIAEDVMYLVNGEILRHQHKIFDQIGAPADGRFGIDGSFNAKR